ncbi:molybdopterin molybdotransferase MoeA [Burkholderiaceae bacterium FT117]|uniref:molybdopterin molybdotransferase MoeA n=1 Tax=Zeimonas sediminis TaxID=2944268 RepID=UPI002342C07B|nr:gephyrin-like molybdotransferase Glp [Zeimonas sediminis]MCM5572110.1 molybdopterin molybdotransferase MoeA [Zeimonas sediminis]
MNSGLLPFDEALAALLAQAGTIDGIERVDTLNASGRVLADDIRSTLNVPPADNTQMDGYALRSADVAGASPESPARLKVAQRIPAGHVGEPLAAGTAARIFTGALIPEGADAVVMQEATRADGDDVLVMQAARPGEWVRRAGEDIRADSVILPAGTRLAPQAVGLAASVGLAHLPVRRRLRAACFFTGDELARPGEPLKPGAIYDSNRYVLVSLLRGLGCEVSDLGNVPDSLEATRDALRAAAIDNDLIVTSGGMSVGEEDHVRAAVQAEGELTMWQIAIKPGKPLAHGRVRRDGMSAAALAASALSGVPMAVPAALPGDAHFIGLPGNPVSAFVTFLLFVRPFLLRLQGVQKVEPQALALVADFDWPKPDRRREFLRARLGESGRLELFPNQGSGVLTSTVWADGLIDNPPGNPIRRGDTVRYLPFGSLLG